MLGLPIYERALTVVGIQNKITLYESAFGRVPRAPEMFKGNALYMRSK